MKKRKGKLEEILSITLKEFIDLSSNFESIPISRIVKIKNGPDVIYSKSNSEKNSQ